MWRGWWRNAFGCAYLCEFLEIVGDLDGFLSVFELLDTADGLVRLQLLLFHDDALYVDLLNDLVERQGIDGSDLGVVQVHEVLQATLERILIALETQLDARVFRRLFDDFLDFVLGEAMQIELRQAAGDFFARSSHVSLACL